MAHWECGRVSVKAAYGTYDALCKARETTDFLWFLRTQRDIGASPAYGTSASLPRPVSRHIVQ